MSSIFVARPEQITRDRTLTKVGKWRMLEAVSIVSKCFGGVTQTGTTPAAGFADACFARAAVGWAPAERNSVTSSDLFDFPKELVRRELAALRRLAIDRRDAATRLPVLKR